MKKIFLRLVSKNHSRKIYTKTCEETKKIKIVSVIIMRMYV